MIVFTTEYTPENATGAMTSSARYLVSHKETLRACTDENIIVSATDKTKLPLPRRFVSITKQLLLLVIRSNQFQRVYRPKSNRCKPDARPERHGQAI